jgi:glutathione S-transferase
MSSRGRCSTSYALTAGRRANSVNVQKVLWCLHELDLAYHRIDAGAYE